LTNGAKVLIDLTTANAESYQSGLDFLRGMIKRGLRVPLTVTTDGAGGLIKAVETVWPKSKRIRCWFHKMQSVAGKLRRKDQTRVLRGLRPVYQAPHRRTAERAALAWAELWRERYPAAVACIAQDLNALPAFYDVPAAQRRMVRTTNPSARRFREVRRQTDSIGTSVNDARRERIVYGLPAYYNGKHAACVCKEFRKVRCGA
jgi:transposase-like protein